MNTEEFRTCQGGRKEQEGMEIEREEEIVAELEKELVSIQEKNTLVEREMATLREVHSDRNNEKECDFGTALTAMKIISDNFFEGLVEISVQRGS